MGKKAETSILILVRDAATKPLQEVTNRLRGMDKALKHAAKAAVQAGKQMLSASAVMGAAAAVPLKFAADFSDAMSQVQAQFGILDKTEQRFKNLEKAALAAGESTKFTNVEAAKALQLLATRGFDVEESISAMQPTLQLAAATEIELTEATDVLADTMKQYKIEAKEAGAVADILTAIHSKSGANILSTAEAFGKSAIQARNAGVSMQQLGAMTMKLGDAGIRGEEAGTALRNIFLRIANPATDAAKLFADLGITIKDSNGNFRDMFDILENIREATEGMGTADRSAVFDVLFGKRAVTQATEILMTTNDELRKTTELLETSSGMAALMSAVRLDSLTGDITILKSALSSLLALAGAQLMPYLRIWVQGIKDIVLKAREWILSNQETAKTISKVVVGVTAGVAVMGGLTIAVGAATFALSGVTTVLKLFSGVITGTITLILKFSTVLLTTLIRGALLPFKVAIFGSIAVLKIFGMTLLFTARGILLPFRLMSIAAAAGVTAFKVSIAATKTVLLAFRTAMLSTKGTLLLLKGILTTAFAPVAIIAITGAIIYFRNEISEWIGSMTLFGKTIDQWTEQIIVHFQKIFTDLIYYITLAAKVGKKYGTLGFADTKDLESTLDAYAKKSIMLGGQLETMKRRHAKEQKKRIEEEGKQSKGMLENMLENAKDYTKKFQDKLSEFTGINKETLKDFGDHVKERVKEVSGSSGEIGEKAIEKLAQLSGKLADHLGIDTEKFLNSVFPEDADKQLRERFMRTIDGIKKDLAATTNVSKKEQEKGPTAFEAGISQSEKQLQLYDKLQAADTRMRQAQLASLEEVEGKELEVLRLKQQLELEQLEQQQAKRMEQFEKEYGDLEDYYDWKLSLEENFQLERAAVIEKQEAQLKKIEEQKRQENLQAWLSGISLTAQGMDSLFGDLFELSGQKIKEFAMLSKAAAMMDATVKGAQAVLNAYANVPYPLNIAAAAIMAAKTAAQVGVIAMQSLPGYAIGGYITDGTTTTADDVLIRASKKEGVINARATAAYGGPNFIHAVNRGLLPIQPILDWVSSAKIGYVPPVPRLAFAAGGVVPSVSPPRQMIEQKPPEVHLHQANIIDEAMMGRWMASTTGKRMLKNVISDNPDIVRGG